MKTLRPISTIAREVISVWSQTGKGVHYAAKPYLHAMLSLNSIKDHYIADSGYSVVAYALSNMRSFRGPEAKMLKAELKRHLAS